MIIFVKNLRICGAFNLIYKYDGKNIIHRNFVRKKEQLYKIANIFWNLVVKIKQNR